MKKEKEKKVLEKQYRRKKSSERRWISRVRLISLKTKSEKGRDDFDVVTDK